MDPQGWNRYSYVDNQALRFVDPTGRQKQASCDFINLPPDSTIIRVQLTCDDPASGSGEQGKPPGSGPPSIPPGTDAATGSEPTDPPRADDPLEGAKGHDSSTTEEKNKDKSKKKKTRGDCVRETIKSEMKSEAVFYTATGTSLSAIMASCAMSGPGMAECWGIVGGAYGWIFGVHEAVAAI